MSTDPIVPTLPATPPAVRIFPLNLEQFPDCDGTEDIQKKYFLQKLPSRRNGRFRCYNGLKAERGTVVLFQFNNAIIASAIFDKSERLKQPDEDGFKGVLYFAVPSIKVFKPVDLEAVSAIWSEVKRFSHVKWRLNPEGYAAFEQVLRSIEIPKLGA